MKLTPLTSAIFATLFLVTIGLIGAVVLSSSVVVAATVLAGLAWALRIYALWRSNNYPS